MDDIMHIRSKLINRFLAGYLRNYILERLKLNKLVVTIDSMELENKNGNIAINAELRAVLPMDEAEKIVINMGF